MPEDRLRHAGANAPGIDAGHGAGRRRAAARPNNGRAPDTSGLPRGGVVAVKPRSAAIPVRRGKAGSRLGAPPQGRRADISVPMPDGSVGLPTLPRRSVAPPLADCRVEWRLLSRRRRPHARGTRRARQASRPSTGSDWHAGPPVREPTPKIGEAVDIGGAGGALVGVAHGVSSFYVVCSVFSFIPWQAMTDAGHRGAVAPCTACEATACLQDRCARP